MSYTPPNIIGVQAAANLGYDAGTGTVHINSGENVASAIKTSGADTVAVTFDQAIDLSRAYLAIAPLADPTPVTGSAVAWLTPGFSTTDDPTAITTLTVRFTALHVVTATGVASIVTEIPESWELAVLPVSP